MAHEIDYEIIGDDMQAAIITLDGNEMLQAEAGSMMFMTGGIQMNTGTGVGLLKGVKRILSGESFFITTFQNTASGRERVAFGAPYPGKIIPMDLTKMGAMALSEGCLLVLGLRHRYFNCFYKTAWRRLFWRRRIYFAKIAR